MRTVEANDSSQFIFTFACSGMHNYLLLFLIFSTALFPREALNLLGDKT